MRHAGPWDKNPKRAFLNGPIVAPGQYTAELTINGKILKDDFEILMDPKIVKSGIRIHDLRAQEKLALEIRDLLDESKMLAYRVKDAETGTSLKIKSALVTAKGPYPQPMLIDQTQYLGSMINRADQRPGNDAYIRFEELSSWFNTIKNSYNSMGDQ